MTEHSASTEEVVSVRFDSVRLAELADSAADLAIDRRYLVAISVSMRSAGDSAAVNPVELQICATAVFVKVKA